MELPKYYVEDGELKIRDESEYCDQACEIAARLYPRFFNLKAKRKIPD